MGIHSGEGSNQLPTNIHGVVSNGLIKDVTTLYGIIPVTKHLLADAPFKLRAPGRKLTVTMNKPNVRERRFVDAYLGSAKANSTEAVIAAGLTKNRNSARVMGTRLLASVNVQAALEARLAKETAASILSARERDEMLSHFARTSGDIHARIRAIAELNKCSGRHSVKQLHEGRLTLEQVLGDSRK